MEDFNTMLLIINITSSKKNEILICYNVNAKWKKSYTQGHILHGSIYMKYQI